MKKTIIMACALSAVHMNVQCMGEQQDIIQQHLREQERKPQPPPYFAPPPSVPSSFMSATAPLINDVERGGNGSIISPEENNIYNGTLYPANTTTFGQFWQAYRIPANERYRSGPQLDDYVKNRQNEQTARECAECSRKACCCLCIAGGVAGALTGLVYCCKWLANYEPDWYWDYDTDTPPPLHSYSQSYSHSQNYTLQVITALVNNSKKMK